MPSTLGVEAAIARKPNAPLTLENVTLEEPRAREILVRVVATGVCHTDIAMRDQTFPVPQPIVLGHEGSGIVERVGSGVRKVAPGDHVVMSYNSCENCAPCLDNAAQYCYDFFGRNFGGSRPDGSSAISQDGQNIHGNFFGQSSFANFAICHERNVVKIRSDVPLELMGPLGCGLLTGAGAVVNALKVRPGQSLAVFGVGAVGLSAIMAARFAGAGTIIAVDVIPSRLALAKELGATHTIGGSKNGVAAKILAILPHGANFAFDTTGLPSVIRDAVDALAPRGICGIVGASAPGSEIALDATHVMTAGRQLRGIVEGDARPDLFIPELIEHYVAGRFPLDRLVRFYEFSAINSAIDDMTNGSAIKPIVRMAGGV